MAAEVCEPPGSSPPGDERSPRRDRLVLILELLMFLPARPPGASMEDLAVELHVCRRTVYRLVAHVRVAGIEIESCFRPDGKSGYYLGTRGHGPNGLLQKLGIA